MIAAIKALPNSKKGEAFLKTNIQEDEAGAFLIAFPGAEQVRKFFSKKIKEVPLIKTTQNDLFFFKKRFLSTGTLSRALEIALYKCNEQHKLNLGNAITNILSDNPLEFGLANKTLTLLTGEVPKDIGDKNLSSLNSFFNKKNKKEAELFLDEISEKTHSTVAGSILIPKNKDIQYCHYYVIKETNKEQKSITLEDPRKPNKFVKIPYEQFFKNFRSIVGYTD